MYAKTKKIKLKSYLLLSYLILLFSLNLAETHMTILKTKTLANKIKLRFKAFFKKLKSHTNKLNQLTILTT
jgi:hypothetical protein